MNRDFSKEAILSHLTTKRIGKELFFFEETGSTNRDAKEYAAKNMGEAVFVAASQTEGRGRMTRSFVSPKGKGIYLSVLLRPNLSATDINTVTLLAAVAVSDAIDELTGKLPSIKWTNDLYFDGKKICGILTECALESDGGLKHLIIGIGVNLYETADDFPEELREKAGSVFSQTGLTVDRAELAACILSKLERLIFEEHFPKNKASFLQSYKDRMLYLNETVDVTSAKGDFSAVVRDLDEEGRLVVEADGKLLTLNSAEISIRGQ